MLPTRTPLEAIREKDNQAFITAFYWQKHPVLERIQRAKIEKSCGELCSLRFTWNRPKKFASDENGFVFDTLAAMIDGAMRLAEDNIFFLKIEKVPMQNNLFALAMFTNGIAAEFELNECLPDTMTDICFLKANFSNGHLTNQPIVGHFNEEGMVFATDEQIQYPIAELINAIPANGPIEQMKQRFQIAVERNEIASGKGNAPIIIQKIMEASA